MCHTLLEISVHLNLDMKMLRKHLHRHLNIGHNYILQCIRKDGCFGGHVWQPGNS